MNKVLYVVPSSFTLHYHLRGHLAFLRQHGFEVEVACEDDSRGLEAAKREGVRLHLVTIRNGFRPTADAMAFLRLLRIMRRGQYDLVNCCTKKGGLLAALAARCAGISNLVYVVHGVSTKHGGRVRQKLLSVIEKLICSTADRVLFMSRSNLELFYRYRACPRSKMIVIASGSANGVDTARFGRTDQAEQSARLLRSDCQIPGNAFVVGFVGRLTLAKGIRELTGAWKQLRNRYPFLHLLVVSPPEVDQDVGAAVEELRADPRVHFPGFMEDPSSAFAAMDCLLLPSYSEGFGVVLLEAGAMEIPVIASRVSGCVDAVIHGETGLLIEPRSAHALTDAIEWVLLHPDVTREWGRNARQRGIREFRPETIWKGYLDLYQSLIADRECKPPDVPHPDTGSHRNMLTTPQLTNLHNPTGRDGRICPFWSEPYG